jgi:dihydropteroate synthase
MASTTASTTTSGRRPEASALVIPGASGSLTYAGRALVMGILNTTPDSFSDGGRFLDAEAAVAQAERMAADGADVIDIGGESTRPGSAPVPLEEELRRVVPVVRRLAKTLSIPLSVDTSKAEVAAQAIDAGASFINDVTALRGDPAMAGVAARSGAGVILMHMQGTPQTMQQHPEYADVIEDIAAALLERVEAAQAAGIARDRLLIDPGLGFGKTLDHNLALMRHLDRFVTLGPPVVLGPSRKSFIGAVLGGAPAGERLAGTLACVALAQQAGVQVVRVHDVKPAVDMLRVLAAAGP